VREERFDQQPRLRRAAATQFDQAWRNVEVFGDLVPALLQDAVLRARGVVLGKLTDLFEELRPPLVVEETTRELLCRKGEAPTDLFGERCSGTGGVGGDELQPL
jgi:hypothetical protein